MFSSSFDSRLLRPIHANVRSTIHRFGSTANQCRSERFTISICHGPNALTAAAVAVSNGGWVDDEVEHQAERVDTDVPQRVSDFRACVVAGRIDTGPPVLRAVDALAVDNGCSRVGFLFRLPAHSDIKRVIHTFQRAFHSHRTKYSNTIVRGGTSVGSARHWQPVPSR